MRPRTQKLGGATPDKRSRFLATDFGTSDIAARLREGGMRIAANRDNWNIPPIDTLFLQRKIGGIFLLASRLKARVRIRAILEKYL